MNTTTRQAVHTMSRLRRIFVGLMAVTAVVVGIIGVSAPANAYGDIDHAGAYSNAVYPSTATAYGNVVLVPAFAVGRNGMVPLGHSQRTAIAYTLDKWNGSSWVGVSRMTSYPTITQSMQYAYDQGATLTTYGAGFYRLRVAVSWGLENTIGTENLWYGVRVMVSTTTADLRCGIARCAATGGYVQI